ncbi:MAG: chemotaxis protein [Pirellulales bacterium]|nr:chemotaxis protein [Pirellulales bacterium]
MTTATSKRSAIDTGILLEAGTNELEVLVLQLAGQRFGVNVAKVREVLPVGAITALPQSQHAVEGVVRIRDQVVEVVNLCRFLDGDVPAAEPQPTDRLLVLEFNREMLAFRVHAVERIHRISWTQMQPMPALKADHVPVTGVMRLDGRLVLMLDFETIGASIGMGRALMQAEHQQIQSVEHASDRVCDAPIVLAEDSQMITAMALDALQEAGFHHVQAFADGQAAWDHLATCAQRAAGGDASALVGAVISDIEMPRMDGLTLVRRIRETPALARVPVILFSSIVSRDNEKKGQQVGADAQVTKPRYSALVAQLRELIEQRGATDVRTAC